MMLHTKSPRRSLLKLLALLPIVGVTLALNARTVTDYVYDEPQKQQPVKKGKKNATIKTNNGRTILQVVETRDQNKAEAPKTEERKELNETEIITSDKQPQAPKGTFDVVEEMPQYPGGPQELFGFLARNIKYPVDAQKAGKQGRVIVTFVVDVDGSINDAKVIKSVDPSLDAEALRVINLMPKWQPGKQSGQPVKVKYTVPVSFRLNGDKTTPAADEKQTDQSSEINVVSYGPKTANTNINTDETIENISAKDIANRIPGAKIDENGNITVNGKAVKRILVDGKPVSTDELNK